MKIGKLTLKPGAPNAERLAETTGLSVKEMRGALEGHCNADMVARAVNACLAEPLEPHDLAVAIDKAGVSELRAAVAARFGAKGARSAED